MLFRPTYCCSCGDKIERAQWRFWTSTRFCEICESTNKPFELLSRGAMLLGGLISIFWIGNLIVPVSGDEQKPENAKIVAVHNRDDGRSQQKLRSLKADPQTSDADEAQVAKNDVLPAKESSPLTLSTKQNDSPERVYICGARTKKGTACSRRVKKAGTRCWQHQGMPAMKDEVPASDKDF